MLTPGQGVHGVRETFDYTYTGGVTDTFDEVALTNADQTDVYLLVLHCTTSCYSNDQTQINDVMSSFTVRSPVMSKAQAASTDVAGLPPPGERPRDDDRPTRKPLPFWDRIKFLLLLALLWFILVWSVMANDPIVGVRGRDADRGPDRLVGVRPRSAWK